MPHEPGSIDDILTFELVEEPLSETPLDRFESLSHAQILRAFVRRGWHGDGWVAYGPTEPTHALAGVPLLARAFEFESEAEALGFVARWIYDMAIRPDDE